MCVPGRCEFRHVCEQEIQGREKGRRRRKEKERESEWIITSKTRKSIIQVYMYVPTRRSQIHSDTFVAYLAVQ